MSHRDAFQGCDHWTDPERDPWAGGYCRRLPTRQYQNGRRCDLHTPAALNGRTVPVPDPDLTLDALRADAQRARESR